MARKAPPKTVVPAAKSGLFFISWKIFFKQVYRKGLFGSFA